MKQFLFLVMVLWSSVSTAAEHVCDTALFMDDGLFLVSRQATKPVERVDPIYTLHGIYDRSKDCRWVAFGGRLVDLTKVNQPTELPDFATFVRGQFSEDSRWLVYFHEREKQYYSIDLKTLSFHALDFKVSDAIGFEFVPGRDLIVADVKGSLSVIPLDGQPAKVIRDPYGYQGLIRDFLLLPDGKLLFTENLGPGGMEIIMVSVDGSQRQTVYHTGPRALDGIDLLQSTSDGKKVFVNVITDLFHSEENELLVVDLATASGTLLSKDFRSEWFFAVSPDNSRVFYFDAKIEECVSANLDGSDKRALEIGIPDKLDFSKDGQRMLVTEGLFSANIDGTDAKYVRAPEDSEDGGWLIHWTLVKNANAFFAFVRNKEGFAELLRADIKAGEAESITTTLWSASQIMNLIASPDGKDLLFFVKAGDEMQLFRNVIGSKDFTYITKFAIDRWDEQQNLDRVHSLSFGSNRK